MYVILKSTDLNRWSATNDYHIGHYTPSGHFVTRAHTMQIVTAMKLVSYLNGGPPPTKGILWFDPDAIKFE